MDALYEAQKILYTALRLAKRDTALLARECRVAGGGPHWAHARAERREAALRSALKATSDAINTLV